MTNSFDVVVIGAGPAGSATALALARARPGLRIGLFEASNFIGPRIGETIPPSTRALLAQLGLWEAFSAEAHNPCHGSASLWGSDVIGYNDFLFNPLGHGYHLDRHRFDPWLSRQAQAAGATLHLGVRVEAVKPASTGQFCLSVVTSAGAPGVSTSVQAQFVVVATGRSGRIARLLGATRQVHDRMTFVYGFFEPGDAAGTSLTMLEAAPWGWWYGAQLPDGRLVVAAATDPERIRQEGLHRAQVFLARLRETRLVGGALARGATWRGAPIACAALSGCLDLAAGPGWLAVGDAASSFDPLSSQGIHKALEDALRAAPAITAFLDDDAGPIEAYHLHNVARFDDYLRIRAYFYSQEGRWPKAAFWANRRLADRAGLLSVTPPLRSLAIDRSERTA